MRTPFLRPLSYLLALALPAAALGGNGVWTTNGPHGGSVNAVVFDPTSTDRLVAIGRGGVFQTLDAGASWSRFESGALVNFPTALAVANDGTLYMASNNADVYRSSGGGAWSLTGFGVPPGAYVTGIAVRPGNSSHVGLLSWNGLWFSTDGGATWTAPASGLPGGAQFVALARGNARLYAATTEVVAPATSPVFVSTDGGANWTSTGPLPGGGYFGYVADLAVAPSDDNRVYLAAGSGVYASSDGGASWSSLPLPAADTGIPRSVEVHPSLPGHLFVGFGTGFYSTNDGGTTWTPLDGGLSPDGARKALVEDIALAPSYPADDRIWIASDPGGLWRSDDAGASWAIAQDGIESTLIRSIAIHPANSNNMWAGYGDGMGASPALFRSSGAGWVRSNAGMTALSIRAIAVDPTSGMLPGTEVLYAVGSSYGIEWFDGSGPPDSGIYKSTDGGVSWSVLDGGLPSYLGHSYIGTQRSVVLDPRSCASPPLSGPCPLGSGPLQTVYVAGSGRVESGSYAAARIHKSTDGGATWVASDTGLPSAPVGTYPCELRQAAIPLVLDPSDSSTLYVGLFLSQFDETSCPAPMLANGVFRSIDGGASWQHRSNGLPRWSGGSSSHYDVLALAVDPVTTSTLYAAVGRNLTDNRIFKSIDSGANWSEISVGIAGADVRALLVDGSAPNIVYAASGGSVVNPGGVYRSEDGGLTWNSISIGLPADAATALALDPADPDRLLAGTSSSVWELTQDVDADLDGAPSWAEIEAPNSGDGDANGVQDSDEASVASFYGESGTPAGAASVAAKGMALAQVTMALTPLDGNCTRINNAHALPAITLPRDDARGGAPSHFANFGVLRFEIPDCRAATVDITVHGADFSDVDWSWRNFGPLVPGQADSMGWYGFAGAVKVDADTWRLTLRAGEQGSYRDDPENILFVGAPGFVDIQIFGAGFED